jgi:hypothetical protein
VAVLNFIAAAAALASGAVDLTIGTVAFSGTAAAAGAGAVDGSLGSLINFSGTAAAAGAGAIDGTKLLQFAGSAAAEASGDAFPSTTHSFTARADAMAGGSVVALVDGQGLTVEEVVRTALPLIGYGCCDYADLESCIRNSLMEAVNAGLQQIFSQAHRLDYFNRAQLELVITGGTNSGTLSQNVQNILKPIRLSTTKTPLHELASIHDIDHYGALYHGGASYAPSTPRAFFLRSMNQSKGDNVALTLYVAPTPSVDTTLLVDVSTEPPRYTWADVTAGTPVEIPHRFAETILIPLVRHWATSHRNFTRDDLLPAIKEQYAIARQTLGLVDPASPDTHAKKQSQPT